MIHEGVQQGKSMLAFFRHQAISQQKTPLPQKPGSDAFGEVFSYGFIQYATMFFWLETLIV